MSNAVPWSETSHWLYGLLGFLGIVLLVLLIVVNMRKAFGRVPPFHEELDKRDKAIRKQIYAAENNLRRQFMGLHEAQVQRITMLEEQFAEMQRDRIRKWEELKNGLSDLAANVAFMRGKLEGEEEKS